MKNILIKVLKNEHVVLTVACAIFLTLIGLSINKFSIWHDESYSATLIESGYGEIIERTAKDVHPPLYYLGLKAWSNVFGDKIVTLRLFSTVTMLSAIIIIWWLIRKHYSKRVAALALLFMSVGPFLVRYGQEMRMYGLAALWASLATFFYYKTIGKKKIKVIHAVGYGVVIAAGFLTQYFFILVPLAHFIHVVLNARRIKSSLMQSLKPYLIPVLIASGIVLPWLPTIYKQYTDVYGAFWIGPVGVETLTSTPVAMTIFLKQFEMTGLLGALGVFTLALLVFLVRKVFSQYKNNFTSLLLVSVISPPVILFILSIPPFQPSYQDRYMSFFATIFYSILAIAIYAFKNTKKRGLLVSLVLVILTTGQFFHYRDGNNHGWSPKPYFRMNEISSRVLEGGNYPVYSTTLWTFFDANITFKNYNYAGSVQMIVDQYPTSKTGNWSAVYGRDELFTTTIEPSTDYFWVIDESSPMYKGDALMGYKEVSKENFGYATLTKYSR